MAWVRIPLSSHSTTTFQGGSIFLGASRFPFWCYHFFFLYPRMRHCEHFHFACKLHTKSNRHMLKWRRLAPLPNAPPDACRKPHVGLTSLAIFYSTLDYGAHVHCIANFESRDASTVRAKQHGDSARSPRASATLDSHSQTSNVAGHGSSQGSSGRLPHVVIFFFFFFFYRTTKR